MTYKEVNGNGHLRGTIASDEATLVWIEPKTGAFLSGVKVRLNDPYDRADTQRTMELVRQFFIDRQTDVVIVKKASTSGRFSAAPAAFKLETVIVLAAHCEVVFKSAQTLAAFAKKTKVDTSSVPHKYQHDAHLAALAGVA